MPWSQNLLRVEDVENPMCLGGRQRNREEHCLSHQTNLQSCRYPHQCVSYLVNWDTMSK